MLTSDLVNSTGVFSMMTLFFSRNCFPSGTKRLMEHDERIVMRRQQRVIWKSFFCKGMLNYFAKVSNSHHFRNNEIGSSNKNDIINAGIVDGGEVGVADGVVDLASQAQLKCLVR